MGVGAMLGRTRFLGVVLLIAAVAWWAALRFTGDRSESTSQNTGESAEPVPRPSGASPTDQPLDASVGGTRRNEAQETPRATDAQDPVIPVVNGVVVDESGSPIHGALVAVESDATLTDVTNAAGQFTIDDAKGWGAKRIVATAVGMALLVNVCETALDSEFSVEG